MNSRAFTKREVKSWLNVMSDDETRPALCGVAFSGGHLVMTNGYVLVALNIKDDWREEYEDFGTHHSYIIKRSAIKEWLKTHGAKDELTVEELAQMEREDGAYPEWKGLIPTGEPEAHNPTVSSALVGAVAEVFFNRDFTISTYKDYAPVVLDTVNDDYHDIALIMPLREYCKHGYGRAL